MNLANVTFLEEYKRLDKLCRDIYQSEKGVSSYIDNMKAVSTPGYRHIANWDVDFKMLIRLRHIRNQLTHDTGTLDLPMCSQSDIEWLANFHQRIMTASDPLALCVKYTAYKPQKSVTVHARQSADALNRPSQRKQSESRIVLLSLLLFIGITFVTLMILMLHNQ